MTTKGCIFHGSVGHKNQSQKPTGSRTNIKGGANVHSHRERVWSGGVMAKALASDSRVCEFNSRPFHCQVTTLGKLFTHVPLYNLVPVAQQRCPAAGKVTVGLASHWPCVTDLSGLST